MTARKTKKKVFTKAEDVAQFTLATPEENPTPEVKNNTISFSPIVQDSSEESIFWHTKKGKIWMSLFGALIVLALVAGLFMYREGIAKSGVNSQSVAASSPASVEVSPTPTPEAINRSEWSFEVLNGSGVAGSAKKAADKLEALGYKVISTDNANASDYTGNKLYVTADMASKQALLIADLKADFNIASVSGVLKGSTASARLIVGK